MRLYGSVNITEVQDNSNQIFGTVNVCTPIVYGGGCNISGESVLYGVVSNVIIKIDIVPDEIKQALLRSGVKFS